MHLAGIIVSQEEVQRLKDNSKVIQMHASLSEEVIESRERVKILEVS